MLVAQLRKTGQAHLAELLEKKADGIDPQRIAQDLEQIDHGLMQRLMAGENIFTPPQGLITPAQAFPAAFRATPEAQTFRAHGEALLAAGKVGVVLVAGGQGSRLGVSIPKGCLGVTPLTGKSLFQVHAEKILALARRWGVTIPFYIMTSRANDADTKAFFKDNNYFGLPPADVSFFTQGMLPSLTPEGLYILDREGGLFMNPDGHGGTLGALRRSGCLEHMAQHGIEEIFYFQVDNPLVKICDPLFIGLHNKRGAQMSSKVVRKRDTAEKVGVVAQVDGRTTVIEYSDMPAALLETVDAAGHMLHWAGSIAIHMLRRDFVEQLTEGGLSLPYHKAAKKIPTRLADGRETELPGIKYETFIFDALPRCTASITLEVARAEEFAPVKNATGEDSLESSQAMQSALHRAWLAEAGRHIPEGVCVEISPLFAQDAAEVQSRSSEIPMEITKDIYIA